MEIGEILQGIFQYGVGTFCVAYVIILQKTVLRDICDALTKNTEALNNINTRLSIIEDKLERESR